MGMLFYRSKVNLLTGWIHHSVYVFIVEYAIQGHWSHIFGLFAVMEVSAAYAVFPDFFFSDACQVPTFVLAVGSLVPHLRSDAFFAVCFFLTRIALHIALSVSLVIQRHEVTNGSFGPAIITACIFPLHAYWFSGCLKGFYKRAKVVEASAPTAKASVNTISSPGMLFSHPFP